ncbi:hypothetical protein BBD42_01105 [Paenibacillus sp. BIHB 4019]|uniref:Uncharacterized protein n=1 Tax=Paenibacillus sp. BIHB 4019 TaxID=1870819 RepID=A0A1B2DBZ6_9BACL|nr:hypothetical protein [Paenibacillus sp. BIHB 4019]ANY65231.1 hypothetical protein BBD42_01105 [Paenibacillus sp. BIHB 4019]
MSQVMTREEALADFLERHVFDRWQEDVLLVNDIYEEHQEAIDAELAGAFEALCVQAAELQAAEKQGKLKYIYISYLRTSIMEGHCTYRLDAYDERWLMDASGCAVSWEPAFLFAPMFERVKLLEAERVAYARKVTLMDIDDICQLEAEKCHTLAIEFVRGQMEKLIQLEAFTALAKAEGWAIAMGEYRDQTEILAEDGHGVRTLDEPDDSEDAEEEEQEQRQGQLQKQLQEQQDGKDGAS